MFAAFVYTGVAEDQSASMEGPSGFKQASNGWCSGGCPVLYPWRGLMRGLKETVHRWNNIAPTPYDFAYNWSDFPIHPATGSGSDLPKARYDT